MSLVKHSMRTLRRACLCHNRTDLYWAHDTLVTTYQSAGSNHRAGDPIPFCDKCGVTGAFVMIEATPSTEAAKQGDCVPEDARHVKGTTPDGNDQDTAHNEDKQASPSASPNMPADWATSPAMDHAGTPIPHKSVPEPAVAPADDRMGALSALLDLLAPKVDRTQVEAIVAEAVAGIVQPTRTVVVDPSGTEIRKVEGASHVMLAEVTTDLLAGVNVLMVGPAGTGKSTIARQAAEALGLEYAEISLNPALTATALLGYMNVTGDYVRTLFREIWEHGGVFHADEFDNGHPSTMATLNAALAAENPGDMIAFPDGMVKRHADTRFIASANTFGRGPDRMYVGRQQLDAATLDRFVVEEIQVDETLEHAACQATGVPASTVTEVLRYVRALRASAESQKLMMLFSPRASIGACRLLQAGKTAEQVVASRIRKGLSDADWRKAAGGVTALRIP